MNAPFLSPIPPIFSRSSVSSVSSSTSKRRGLLRTSAPVLLALVLGVGLAGCDDTASTSSDAPSSTAPAESQQDSGSDGSADSEEEATSEPEPQKEFYANCDDAKAAGAAPMYKGDPGYRPELDRDKDGIACDQNK